MDRKLNIVFSVFLGVLLFFSLHPGEVKAGTFDKVTKTLKAVAISAISVGIDEAGSRLLGPNVWRIVKKIGEPVIGELLADGDKPNQSQVDKVIQKIDNDVVIRNSIQENYKALPRSDRELFLAKFKEIENYLVRIERLSQDTNLEVKEIKRLMLSIFRALNSASLNVPEAVPDGLYRVDPYNSLLSIYYPKGLKTPRKGDGSMFWFAGAEIEKSKWNILFDKDEPFMTFWNLGVPQQPDSVIDNSQEAMEKARQGLLEMSCDLEDQRFPVQEQSKNGTLLVGMCDLTWPAPNLYVAVRLFYSNGAIVLIRSVVSSDEVWEKYEKPLLASMRLTNIRTQCGFYDTACCLSEGDIGSSCEAGLICQDQKCLPASSNIVENNILE